MGDDALSPLRIVIACRHLGVEGGAEAHVLAAADALRTRGHHVLLLGGSGDPSISPPGEVISGLNLPSAPEDAVERFRAALSGFQPHVTHVHDVADPVLHDAARRCSALVWSVHNFMGCTSGYKYFRRPGDECYKPHGPLCLPALVVRGCAHTRDLRHVPRRYALNSRWVRGLRLADVAIAHSDFVLRHLERNRIEPARLAPLFTTVTHPVTEPHEPRRVLFVGRITPVKGLEVLIRAIESVDVTLEVCGDGWGLERARRLAEKRGLSGRVEFRGWVDPEALHDAYRRAGVVVVPSLWPEPFGLVGLDAMAHGRVVVGTRTGGIPEWLADGQTGLLVEPGNVAALRRAVEALVNDRTVAREMGMAGRERVHREFTADRHVTALMDIYSAALIAASERGAALAA